jgi:hypothetical protein
VKTPYINSNRVANNFFKNLERVLSKDRFDSYKQNGKSNDEALKLYVWNTMLCESLYPSFQILEVGIRNAIHLEISKITKEPGWLNNVPAFLYADEQAAIQQAKESLKKRCGNCAEPRLVAEMNFGFWTSLFDSRYETMWHKIIGDADGVFEVFPPGDKYAIAFGKDIIQSIPDGSIYFGGTDPGRFVVTALMESHADGKPFFMLSQNPLPDVTYLHYLRSMYGGKIYIPTDEDLQKSFQDYTADAQRRLAHDRQFPDEPKQLKPGEDVKLDTNGQIQMSGHMNVIGIRELLTKTIFDQNPGRDFYVEESFPLDWMQPYLEPHGLILKINRQPAPELSDEIVQRDSDYWTKYVTPMIGGWLKPDTTLEETAAFVEKIQVKKDLSGFAGDPQFVQNEYWCKNFSKLRSSIGGLYA